MLNFKSCAPAKANVSTFKNSEFVSRIGGERNKEKEEREDETNEIRIPCFFPRDSFLHSLPLLFFFFFKLEKYFHKISRRNDRKEYYKITIGQATFRSILVSSLPLNSSTAARRPKWIHGSSIFRPRRKIPIAALNRPTESSRI